MKRTGFLLMAVAAGTILLGSCRKEPLNDMTQEESRIYITNYDDEADFGAYQTFSIVDSVAVLSSREGSTKERTEYDIALLSKLTAELTARGYVQVDHDANPDLAVNVTRINTTTTSINYYPGYWSGWGGYWDAGYWGFPGYDYYFPSFYSVFNTNERSVAVDIVDLQSPPKEPNTLTVVWNAQLRGSGVWNSTNIDSMIDAVFAQSTYLSAGNN